MRRSTAAAVLFAAALTGCSDEGNGFGSAVRTDATEAVVRTAEQYLDAAAANDAQRLCAMRTRGYLRAAGGRRACAREIEGLGIDAPSNRYSRKAARIDPRSVTVLRKDVSLRGPTASVLLDFGEAFIRAGSPYGGTVLEMALRRESGHYRVSSLGFAAFAD